MHLKINAEHMTLSTSLILIIWVGIKLGLATN